MRVETLVGPALLLIACGEVKVPGRDAGNGTTIDASTDAAEGPDAGPCTWGELSKAPFANLNGPDREESAALSGDGLRVVFTRDLGSLPAIQEASRRDLGEPFGVPALVGALEGPEGKYEIELSSAADELFFLDTTTPDILVSARDGKSGEFNVPFSTGLVGFSPTLSGDGLDLYFHNQGDIFHATRDAVGEAWSQTPDAVGSMGPFKWIDVSADELQLLMSGATPGETPTMAVASRLSTAQSFGDGVSIAPPLDGEAGNEYGEASWDGSGRLIAVTRNDDGNFELYLSACE